MGTTMAYYFVQNLGFSPERLREGLIGLSAKQAAPNLMDSLTALLGYEAVQKMQAEVSATQDHFDHIFQRAPKSRDPRAFIAYQKSSPWLPLYEQDLCESNTASSQDAKRVSMALSAPVLVFSVYDSDVLFVSYCDAAKNLRYDYAKPNLDGFEEYDASLYEEQFPAFLLDYCSPESQDQLRKAWDQPGVIFADDRLESLCSLLQLRLAHGEPPQGFEPIYAE